MKKSIVFLFALAACTPTGLALPETGADPGGNTTMSSPPNATSSDPVVGQACSEDAYCPCDYFCDEGACQLADFNPPCVGDVDMGPPVVHGDVECTGSVDCEPGTVCCIVAGSTSAASLCVTTDDCVSLQGLQSCQTQADCGDLGACCQGDPAPHCCMM